MGRYAGRKAVVIGGTLGMGLATVKALLEGGAEVLLTGRNGKNLEAVRRELGSRAHVVASDATKLADIDALGRTVQEKLGEVDFVFINAGFAKLEPFDQVTEASYVQTFAVNTKGAFFTAQKLAPRVRKGGAFVFTTSVAESLRCRISRASFRAGVKQMSFSNPRCNGRCRRTPWSCRSAARAPASSPSSGTRRCGCSG